MNEPCPLCGSGGASLLHTGEASLGARPFLLCPGCDLVFVPKRFILSEEDQIARYLTHENEVDDPGYRDFLGRLYYSLRPHLTPGAEGLDYGAGPGPALAAMMREDGFTVTTYDPYFCPNASALDRTYDFITCTETAEHFARPATEFERLDGLLRKTGWLGVMTGMLDGWEEFPSWYYHRDPTHMGFYSVTTMRWIANRHSWEPRFPRPNVVLFRKA